MGMKYAARIESGTVTQVIVGDADWATANLGGTWIGSPFKVGDGWLLIDGTFTSPNPDGNVTPDA